ncbi:hypothetical protein ACTHQY_09035 [Rhodococcoides corynebacterioides]|uniref:hypothetical protein n=1 Tax=Rhodococcoides corynebacterioides TaxID=53972 RepID=UPI003F812738
MSTTTTGADTALDLDAIEARADAATVGPWTLIGGGEYVTGAGLLVAPDDGGVSSDDAEFIAHARTDVPVLVAEVRRLRPRVISGDVGVVTAALDGLPVGSIITCDDVLLLLTYQKTAHGLWYATGTSRPFPSTHIARHQVPITVLREGTGA